MGTRKEYQGAAPATTLSGDIDNSTLSFSVASGSGFPTGTNPFVVAIGAEGTAGYEKVLCSARSGNNFTVQAGGRGYDGTTAAAHSANDPVEHVLDAVTISEANSHANDADATAHAAAKITYAGGTGMSATNVEAAIDELATEKISAPSSPTTGDVLTFDGSAWGAEAPSNSGLIGFTVHNPGTVSTYTITSGTVADVDATNLTVSFTVPASGEVLIRLSAVAKVATGGGILKWGLREGSSTIVDPTYVLEGTNSNYVDWIFCSKTLVVTGLTPGASKTYKWAWVSASTASMAAGGQAAGQAGPATMEVIAIPS